MFKQSNSTDTTHRRSLTTTSLKHRNATKKTSNARTRSATAKRKRKQSESSRLNNAAARCHAAHKISKEKTKKKSLQEFSENFAVGIRNKRFFPASRADCASLAGRRLFLRTRKLASVRSLEKVGLAASREFSEALLNLAAC